MQLPPWVFARFRVDKDGVVRRVSQKIVKGKRIVLNPAYKTAPLDGVIVFAKDPYAAIVISGKLRNGEGVKR